MRVRVAYWDLEALRFYRANGRTMSVSLSLLDDPEAETLVNMSIFANLQIPLAATLELVERPDLAEGAG